MTTYITETGSRYEINYEKGFWRKNGGYWEILNWAFGVDSEEARGCRNWADLRVLPKRDIVPGVRLYIGSGDAWWLSTEIKEVVEDGEND